MEMEALTSLGSHITGQDLASAMRSLGAPERRTEDAQTASTSRPRLDTDPVSALITAMVYFFVFFYLASEQVAQLLGFYLPLYQFRSQLTDAAIPENRDDLRSLFRYYYVYAHLEIASALLSIVGIYAYHFKIALILTLLYMMSHRALWLEGIYIRVCSYDEVLVQLVTGLWSKVYAEYERIRRDKKIVDNHDKQE